MDGIYENYDSTAEPKGKSTQHKGQTSCKWTKVLLIVLFVSVVLAVAALCVLGVLYYNKHADFESLTMKQNMILMQLSAQEVNNTMMEKSFEKLTSRYNRIKEWLTFKDENWSSFQGKIYFFSSDKHTWSNSRGVCLSKGADLVTITSKAEQVFLHSKIEETRWIGLNDLETEGRWVWVNNQTLEETGVQFWHRRESGKNEPDNWKEKDPSGENCASMQNAHGISDVWFDQSCQTETKFICEKRSSPYTDDD
ncbi:CD209 antigen-like protein C [Triplophysa dalaica]|uniref:CD209 antigen-like protein C n=1 Tax=Triplophysa dalaica TaxID=1582913 RepID=UPI0024DF8316|nr:CD209 antigen-like protein C [Triplophysa dalaica]